MLFILALALSQIACQFVSATAFVTAPRILTLQVPPKEIAVNTNYSVGLSIDKPHSIASYIGVEASVSISISYPNGTTGNPRHLGLTFATTPCLMIGAVLNSQEYNAAELGMYTAFWSVTYSSDGNVAQDTNSSCTTGNVTQQSWSLNYTFEAVVNQTGVASSTALLPSFIETQLPSAPTAQVQVVGAATAVSVCASLFLYIVLIASFLLLL